MPPRTTEQQTLDIGVQQIEPLLAAHGFARVGGDYGVSSGGSFATCRFGRGDLELGLIVRDKTELGCPNYSEGQGYVGHDALIRRLGREGSEDLVKGAFLSFKSRTGRDSFLALKDDLESIILSALAKSEANFRRALREAHADHMRTFGVTK